METICVLVHGYNKSKRDMRSLSMNIEKLGHRCYLVNLPLRFNTVDEAYEVFVKQIEDIRDAIGENVEINLVGHSTGGLVIRKFISECAENIGRCVLISTPNKGSFLADMANRYARPFCMVFRTLESLRTESVKDIGFENDKSAGIGAIAGNKNNLMMGRLIADINDGRVRVSSVYHEKLDDFIVLPYGHKEIHHRQKTAEYVDNFIRHSDFKLKLR